MVTIPINVAVEDALSDAVVRRLLAHCNKGFAIGSTYSRGGFGYLKRITPGLNNAARGTPFLLLTDLDTSDCPPSLISDWLKVEKHHNFLFRIAIREVEAWLLADRKGIAHLLGVKEALVPGDVDGLADPKAKLLELASKCPKRDLRSDLLPKKNSTSKIGPNYNGRLTRFVLKDWDPADAENWSPSLKRTLNRLREFEPRW